MIKRPEHVKCENCCYWEEYDNISRHPVGMCHRLPPVETLPDGDPCRLHFDVGGGNWCGEFRAEWPEVSS